MFTAGHQHNLPDDMIRSRTRHASLYYRSHAASERVATRFDATAASQYLLIRILHNLALYWASRQQLRRSPPSTALRYEAIMSRTSAATLARTERLNLLFNRGSERR
jgi:hypothetical protein